MSVSIIADALKDVQSYFEALPEIATKSMVLAINDSARDSEVTLRRQMQKEVNFPQGYLRGKRFGVASKANRGNLEALIRGRDRATSLARFVENATSPESGKGKVLRVRVSPGKTINLKRGSGDPSAFLVKLKNGNTGLAIRLKKGEKLSNSVGAKELANNVFLLYGPSVDQVFRGVADDQTDDIQAMVTQKFLRQFTRLSRG
jgi:hypothetical protein